MKRFNKITILLFIFALFLLPASADIVSSKVKEANVSSKRIEQGSRLNLNLLDNITTKTAMMGDSFNAVLSKDLVVDNTIILPAGSIVRGYVSRIKQPSLPSKSAVLYVTFDHVVTTEGRQLPIEAVLCKIDKLTFDGGIISGGNYSWAFKNNWNNSKLIFSDAINWGEDVGSDVLSGNLKYLTVPVGAIGGMFAGSAYMVGMSLADLFQKGSDVILPVNTNFDILLLNDVDVPVN